ncbi:unannotated protein [freshwater metagenome]|uniref:Unannotated protein n=1 Tax=freshwater metagenome TaxID=449393 RepID=A0A6J6Z1K0_9ZZZZ
MSSSPRSPAGTSLPASSMMRNSSTAEQRPELAGRSRYSSPTMNTPMALVSVIPQPVFGVADSSVASICRTCSGARAAPPPPTTRSDERSRLVRRASLTRSCVTAGGPVNALIFSTSMSSAAFSGSHLYIQTILRCARYDERNTACDAVTWNSGIPSSVAACAAGGARVKLRSRPMAVPSSSQENSALSTARCDETTPFG